MNNVIIIHGTCDKEEYFSNNYPSPSNNHWFPWTQKQLLKKNYLVQTPEMPNPYPFAFKYLEWDSVLSGFHLNEESILIGHSAGGGFLIRYLSENKIVIDKLVLVAPWMDPEKSETIDFFEFKIDSELDKRINEIHLFISDNEHVEGVEKSVKEITDNILNIKVHYLKNKGHFILNDIRTTEFRELLEVCL